jgi:hypothetical protein
MSGRKRRPHNAEALYAASRINEQVLDILFMIEMFRYFLAS